VAAITRTEAKKHLQDRQRAWLLRVIETTGLKPSQIARGADVSDTTLTRLLNNPSYEGTLSELTIERIKTTYNLPGPGNDPPAKGGAPVLFSEAELLQFAALEPSIAAALTALCAGITACEIWRLHSSAIENAGYLVNDLVVVDPNATPGPHDAVKAVVTEWSRGSAETIWRLFDPPYLLSSAARQLAAKPLLVDGQRVRVAGVIVASLRPHRLSAAV